ncbi:hypothetical protein BGZ83_004685 [Gryganskiella cystojenkinii]|nr:hypothetical protein BGZ83_004685 [Gryganskiella cystojenkinii]
MSTTYHSFRFLERRDLSSLKDQHWFLTSALWMLYASVVVFHIVVPAIYWGMLFDPNNTMDTLNKYVDFSHHGADFACILFEMVFNRMDLPWFCLLGPISMIILYMFLAWVYYAARGEWLYGFLNWNDSLAAAWYIGLLVAFALLFVLQKYIHLGRDKALASRRLTVASQDGTAPLSGDHQSRNEELHVHVEHVEPKTRADEADLVVEMLEGAAKTLLENNIVQWPLGMFTSPEGRQQIKDAIACGQYYMIMYQTPEEKDDPVIAGLFLLNYEDPFDALLWKGFVEDWLDAIYVHRLLIKKPFQGRGLTGKILSFAESKVKEAGRHYLRLDCLAKNIPLRRFYKEKCLGKDRGGLNELTTIWNPDYQLEFARYEIQVVVKDE